MPQLPPTMILNLMILLSKRYFISEKYKFSQIKKPEANVPNISNIHKY